MRRRLTAWLTVGALLAATSFGAPPTWYVQLSPTMAGPWTNAVSGTSSQMFARLVLSNAPASTITIGSVIMMAPTSSGQASSAFSNGVFMVQAAPPSLNDWNTLTGGSGIHSNQYEVIIPHP